MENHIRRFLLTQNTPIMMAAKSGKKELIELLIKHKADLNISNISLIPKKIQYYLRYFKIAQKQTVLHFAAGCSSPISLSLLAPIAPNLNVVDI